MFLRKVGTYLQVHTTLQPTIPTTICFVSDLNSAVKYRPTTEEVKEPGKKKSVILEY
jgi:hypothetical protein